MEENSVSVLARESLVPTQRGGRQERCAARQIERITVPLQNTHVPIKPLEETVGGTFRRELNGAVADLFRGPRVDLVGIHACAKRISDELTAEADPQGWNRTHGPFSQGQLAAM